MISNIRSPHPTPDGARVPSHLRKFSGVCNDSIGRSNPFSRRVLTNESI